ncbi:MAG: hypothetical protein EPO30_07570 [Lysobacteraceae bacterium]|nr:MAG: hypothetical protein EPO30_07570 [Xanthomonadaceae bacterium]
MAVQKYRLVFSRHRPEDPGTLVLLSPADTGWNDFGYNFHATLVVSPNDARKELNLKAYCIPVDEYGRPIRFATWFEENWRARMRPFTYRSSGFLTLLATDDAYSKLFSWCKSDEEYRNILLTINEITWLRENYGFDAAKFRKIIGSEAFQVGVLRSAGAYRAYRDGFHFGYRKSKAPVDVRKPFSFSVQLPGFSNEHSLDFNYKDLELIEDRVHCLIGRNGIGKTQVLRKLILSLAADEDKENPFLDVHDSEYQNVLTKSSIANPYSRVISYTTEVESALPCGSRADTVFDYQHCNLSLPFDSGTGAKTIASMLVSLVRDDEGPRNKFNRLGALKAAVLPHIDWDSIALPVKKDSGISSISYNGVDWIRFSTFASLNEERLLKASPQVIQDIEIGHFNEEGDPVNVSSGQRVFLRFAVHFLSYASKGSLVIFDEPETHLHPNLISSFAILLYRVLAQTKSVAIVATHSPFIVREVPSHCVHVFQSKSRGSVEISTPYLKTLGASPTSLSLSIFGDDTAKKYYEKLLEAVAPTDLPIAGILQNYGDVLSTDMLIQMRSIIEKRVLNAGD